MNRTTGKQNGNQRENEYQMKTVNSLNEWNCLYKNVILVLQMIDTTRSKTNIQNTNTNSKVRVEQNSGLCFERSKRCVYLNERKCMKNIWFLKNKNVLRVQNK